METGPRRRPQNRENGVIVAHLKKSDPRTSWYQRWGDWPWILLGLGTLMAAYWPLKGGPRTRKKEGLVGENGPNDCDGKLW
jgi:apolipoprotein N-acyltransferase